MKTLNLAVLLAVLVEVSIYLMGCATFQQNAGKTLVTVTQTVDAAMQGWAVWVSLGKATPDQQAKVKAIYEKYQAAELIAEKAYIALSVNSNKTAWQQALAALTAVEGDLLALIKTITGG